MRTVTFADPTVVDFVNERFVAVWNNHSSEYAYAGVQPAYSPEEIKAYPEGGGRGNVRAFVAAPDGKVLAELQGFWSAELFLGWLRFALELTWETKGVKHHERAEALARERQALLDGHPGESKKRVRDSDVLRKAAALSLLAEWHVSSAKKVLDALGDRLDQARWESQKRVFA